RPRVPGPAVARAGWGGPRGAGARGRPPPAAAPAGTAFWRRAPAGRDRPRGREPPGSDPGGRADRQPGLGLWRGPHRAAARAAQRGGNDCGDHARSRHRGGRAPQGRDRRRPPRARREVGGVTRGAALAASRIHPAELLRLGSMGLRTRRLRASLSALGIAIGIAAMVAVLGVSESSRANLIAELNQLGTNLLTATPGNTFRGQTAVLPHEAPATIGRLASVQAASSTALVQGVTVRRTDQISTSTTSGISVRWTDTSLLRTLNGSVYRGQWLNDANAHYPAVVLGWVAAQRLGVVDLKQPTQVYLGDRWFTVI